MPRKYFLSRLAGWRWRGNVWCVFAGMVQLCLSAVAVAQDKRAEAVQAAREGRLEEAIAALRALPKDQDDAPLIAYDLAVILTWAGRPKEATDAFEHSGMQEVPSYVLPPMIRAYRDQKRFKEAERWAREGTKRFPLDATYANLLGLVLADQQRTKEAIALLRPWAATHPEDAEIWLALGYASLGEKDRFATLRNYGQALRLQPKNQEARQVMAGVLDGLGGPFGAAELIPEASISTRASQAGLLARWGEKVVPSDPRRRFEGTDAALARIDKLLREARSARKPDRGVILRLRRDRVVALRMRERWADVIAAAKSLRDDGDKLPPYVLEAEAEALLALRRPTEARRGYEAVLKAEPQNRNAKVGKFYALIEEENFADAFRLVDELASSEDTGLRLPNQSSIQPNDYWLEGQLLASQARSFADMQGEAWKRIRPLADGAPANAEVRTIEGEIAAGREWPRLSDEIIHIAASLSPENKSTQIALADSAIRRGRWGETRERVTDLISLYPADSAVLRTQRDLRLHDSFELFTEFRYRHESAGAEEAADNSPGSGTDATVRIYSPPIGEVFRFIGAWEHHEAKVQEGIAQRYRTGVGLQLALPDLTIEAFGWYNDGSLSQPGADVTVTWQPTDHWTFSADAAYFAADTPLRAVLNQITANSVGGSVKYTWHESRSLILSGHWYDFSDGNRRKSGALTFEQKLVDIPHFDLTVRPELYASENSSDQGPYFSPLRDLSASVTVDAEHVIWRHYERSFGHRLAVTGGAYSQKNFGSQWIGNVLYEQVWQNDPWTQLRWGVQFNSAVYDGDRTPSVETFIQMNLHF